MSDRLRIILMVLIVLMGVAAVRMIHRKRLNLSYSLIWLGMAILLIVAVVFPETVYGLARVVGVDLPINMLFTGFAFFALLMMFYLTGIVSRDNEKIRTLTQQLGLMEKRLRDLEASRKNTDQQE